jgi:hypothetical protein
MAIWKRLTEAYDKVPVDVNMDRVCYVKPGNGETLLHFSGAIDAQFLVLTVKETPDEIQGKRII